MTREVGTPPVTQAPTAATLRIGVLPDTQGSASGVALHAMKAALNLYEQSGVKLVLAVGDLVENGTPAEYALWREMAERYRDTRRPGCPWWPRPA